MSKKQKSKESIKTKFKNFATKENLFLTGIGFVAVMLFSLWSLSGLKP